MNKKRIVYILAFLLQIPGLLYALDVEVLDGYIENARSEWGIPGVAVAIVKDNTVIYCKGFGYQNINDQSKSVDENTIFNIASNTKAFTTASIGMLVQEGKLSWDSKVHDLMPEFELYDPEVTRKVTIRDLLCHRCGLGLWAGDLTWWYSNYDRAEVIRRLRYLEPVTEFRSSYIYTNMMFLVAGELIPKVTDKSWDRFIVDRIFTPLEMTRSLTSSKQLKLYDNVASPHADYTGELVAIDYLDNDNCAPAGSINSCVSDMAKWLKMHLNDGVYDGGKQLLNESIIKEMRKPHNLIVLSDSYRTINPDSHLSAYGLGLRVIDYHGKLVVGHTGELDGMSSYLGYIPEEKIGVVILTNMEGHNLHASLPLFIFDTLMENPFKDWSHLFYERYTQNIHRQEKRKAERLANKPKDTKPTLDLWQYTGTFTSKVYGNATVSMENGKLQMQLSAHPDIIGTIEHYYYDTFLVKWSHKPWKESFAYFRLNGHGKITKFLMSVRPDWMDTLEYEFIKD